MGACVDPLLFSLKRQGFACKLYDGLNTTMLLYDLSLCTWNARAGRIDAFLMIFQTAGYSVVLVVLRSDSLTRGGD
jgi:hypothetical protein